MGFFKLDDIEKREIIPGSTVSFIHSSNMTISHWRFIADAILPKHSHPHEQVTQVLDGEFELTVAEETQLLGPGSIVIIPPNTPHSGKALSDCHLLDVFYPIREDYRDSWSKGYVFRGIANH